MKQPLPFWICAAPGLFLIGVGTLLVFAPDVGGAAFGIHAVGFPDYAFHLVTGVRTIYLGMLLMLLASLRQARVLALVQLTMATMPLADFLVVLQSSNGGWLDAIKHVPGVLILLGLGIYFLRRSS